MEPFFLFFQESGELSARNFFQYLGKDRRNLIEPGAFRSSQKETRQSSL